MLNEYHINYPVSAIINYVNNYLDTIEQDNSPLYDDNHPICRSRMYPYVLGYALIYRNRAVKHSYNNMLDSEHIMGFSSWQNAFGFDYAGPASALFDIQKKLNIDAYENGTSYSITIGGKAHPPGYIHFFKYDKVHNFGDVKIGLSKDECCGGDLQYRHNDECWSLNATVYLYILVQNEEVEYLNDFKYIFSEYELINIMSEWFNEEYEYDEELRNCIELYGHSPDTVNLLKGSPRLSGLEMLSIFLKTMNIDVSVNTLELFKASNVKFKDMYISLSNNTLYNPVALPEFK